MKKFLRYVATVAVAMFALVFLVNNVIDPANLYSDRIFEGFRQGKNVTNLGNINDRKLMAKYIQFHHDESFDFIVFGSSRIMTVSEDALPEKRVMNLGTSGESLMEIAAFYQMLKENNVSYDSVLLGIDPAYFEPNTALSSGLTPYYLQFMGREETLGAKLSKIRDMFSTDYFRLGFNNAKEMRKMQYVDSFKNEGFTYRKDGSIYYDRAKVEKKKENRFETDAVIDRYFRHQFTYCSQEKTALFERLLNVWKEDGKKVFLFVAPFSSYYIQQTMTIPGYCQSYKFVEDYVKSHPENVFGSFHLEQMGLKDSDMYDGAHLRKEVIDKVIQANIPTNQ